MAKKTKYAKIEVFIPEEYIEKLRDKLNKVGVGRVGNYDHCISVTKVKGYWRPLSGANPYAGEIGNISFGEERKLEVSCREENVKEALEVIRETHPYDKPLINVVELLNHQYDGLDF